MATKKTPKAVKQGKKLGNVKPLTRVNALSKIAPLTKFS